MDRYTSLRGAQHIQAAHAPSQATPIMPIGAAFCRREAELVMFGFFAYEVR